MPSSISLKSICLCVCVCVCVYTIETLSYSFENKQPWTIPQPEATRWPTDSYSGDADTERDCSKPPRTAQADSSSAGAEQSHKPITLGKYWLLRSLLSVWLTLASFP